MRKVRFKDSSAAVLAMIHVKDYCVKKRLSCRTEIKKTEITFTGQGEVQAEAYTQGIADGMAEERLAQ